MLLLSLQVECFVLLDDEVPDFVAGLLNPVHNHVTVQTVEPLGLLCWLFETHLEGGTIDHLLLACVVGDGHVDAHLSRVLDCLAHLVGPVVVVLHRVGNGLRAGGVSDVDLPFISA